MQISWDSYIIDENINIGQNSKGWFPFLSFITNIIWEDWILFLKLGC